MKNFDSGLIFLDKPKDITCRKIDNLIMNEFSSRHVGHLGTLDPFATGLIIIGVNEGTKLLSIMEESQKSYIATLKLGIQTDTGDLTGNVIKTLDSLFPSEKEIIKVLNSFIGSFYQTPPLFSAKKINGKAAYKYAHNNETVTLSPVLINVYDIKLLNCNPLEKTITFSCAVSKGTYIRTLGEQIAEKLNTCGHLISLRRTFINNISIDEDYVCSVNNIKCISLLDSAKILNIKTFVLEEKFVGQKLELDEKEKYLIALDKFNLPLAIYEKVNNNIYKVKRGFNND